MPEQLSGFTSKAWILRTKGPCLIYHSRHVTEARNKVNPYMVVCSSIGYFTLSATWPFSCSASLSFLPCHPSTPTASYKFIVCQTTSCTVRVLIQNSLSRLASCLVFLCDSSSFSYRMNTRLPSIWYLVLVEYLWHCAKLWFLAYFSQITTLYRISNRRHGLGYLLDLECYRAKL
jgi:hypothetical protein